MNLCPDIDVSRETFDSLAHFQALVKKWSPRINIVSRGDLEDIWGRHILDSAQIWRKIPETARLWVDFGSGGGFPGVVLAAICKEKRNTIEFIFVESDVRKGAFLRTAIRELDLNAKVETARVEALSPLGADVVSARALSSLNHLLGYAAKHLSETGLAIFPKGRGVDREIQAARVDWDFELERQPSITQAEARILRIRNIRRVSR